MKELVMEGIGREEGSVESRVVGEIVVEVRGVIEEIVRRE